MVAQVPFVYRALRPLRTIQRLPGLKMTVDTVLESLPRLADVAALACLIMVVFGTLGLQLFKGTLRNRCFVKDETLPVDALMGVCSLDAEGEGAAGRCEPGQECRVYGENPLYGTIRCLCIRRLSSPEALCALTGGNTCMSVR